MKIRFLQIGIILLISVHSLYAQVPGNVVGPYIVCNGVTGPFDFYWSERANYQGEMVTYTVTDRSGQAFNPADVSKTVSIWGSNPDHWQYSGY